MMAKLRILMAAMLFAGSLGGATLALATPQMASAAGCGGDKVLLFPKWHRGLSETKGSGKDATCEVKSPASVGGLSKFIWTIALNVIEMALVAVGYISVGFIIWGGFQYMLVATSPDRIVAARKTIINAVVGLVLSFFSVVIVNVIGNGIQGL